MSGKTTAATVPPADPPPVRAIEVGARPLELLEHVLTERQARALRADTARAATALGGRTVWSLNSTAKGGGVAQMLGTSTAYARAGGVDARWLAIGADEAFFRITKRLHHLMHGQAGDAGPLGPAERSVYERTLAAVAADLERRVLPDHIVILHDAQTAGLAPIVRELGAHVVWRCHVGADRTNAATARAWGFLQRYVAAADASVLSSRRFMLPRLVLPRPAVIPPAIDPTTTKNRSMLPATARDILAFSGLAGDGGVGPATFRTGAGGRGAVRHPARIVQDRPLAESERYVLQLSRWDSLKDPVGVLEAFAQHIAPGSELHLVLGGPDPSEVADDPEGEEVLEDVEERWARLAPGVRSRVHVLALPMEDLEENAAMVNALQRGAAVVVKKSISEGFGLGVTEAMWKSKAIVATAVGGVRDQVLAGRTGLLVADPHDLSGFAAAVMELDRDGERAADMGRAGRRRVGERFLEPRHLHAWLALLEAVVARGTVGEVVGGVLHPRPLVAAH